VSHPICRTVIAQFFESVWTNNRCSHPIIITRAPPRPPAGVSAPTLSWAIGPPHRSARIANCMAARVGRRSGPLWKSRSGRGARSMSARRTSAARSGVGGDGRAVRVIPDRGHHPSRNGRRASGATIRRRFASVSGFSTTQAGFPQARGVRPLGWRAHAAARRARDRPPPGPSPQGRVVHHGWVRQDCRRSPSRRPGPAGKLVYPLSTARDGHRGLPDAGAIRRCLWRWPWRPSRCCLAPARWIDATEHHDGLTLTIAGERSSSSLLFWRSACS
jgi:hypothetical protein